MPRLLLACVSLLTFLAMGILALKGVEVALGAHIEEHRIIYPMPILWEEDAVIGYKNKPNVRRKAFGNIFGITDHNGFRIARKGSSKDKTSSLRILGFGDSVTWGYWVNQKNTFLGYLERQLGEKHENPVVMNAAVIGYSTYQERLFFEKYILGVKPDIVLVNFCWNDWLPTKDPFLNVRGIHSKYLRDLIQSELYYFSAQEMKTIENLIGIMENAPHVWTEFERFKSNPLHYDTLQKVLFEIPIQEMSDLARRNGIRLIYLFIPYELEPIKSRQQTVLQLQKFMGANAIEYIDFVVDLRQAKDDLQYERFKIWKRERLEQLIERSQAPGDGFWKRLSPVVTLKHIGQWKYVQRRHATRNFMDTTHLTRKGHQLTARKILTYLGDN